MKQFIWVFALFLSVTAFGGECDSWNLPEDESELRQVNERILGRYTSHRHLGQKPHLGAERNGVARCTGIGVGCQRGSLVLGPAVGK